MAIVAVTGDACTTTAVAMAAAWPAGDDALVVEADASGGDLAAWFDMPVSPSLSTVVTRVLDGAWSDVERFIRVSHSGIRLIPAPARPAEAGQALGEAARALIPTMAARRASVTIADTGSLLSSPASHPFVGAASVTVVVHRQATQSSRAAAVRLQRLADQLEAFAALPSALIVAVVGAQPFGLDEIEMFLTDAVGVNSLVGLPHDELAAAVLGGRTGVSARRLARLPLMKAAADLADRAERSLTAHAGARWGVA